MANPLGSLLGKIGDVAAAAIPLRVRELEREIEDRLRKVPTELNEFGFDRFGMQPERLVRSFLPIALMYRHYFRVETEGIEKVPSGRVLLIANHAGQLPFDAAMLNGAMLLEAETPRIARGMGEYWIPQLPFVSVAAARGGHAVGTPGNCVALLEAEECVAVFPEGVRGMNKTYDQRYQLQRMGLGFLRIALETGTPIVPVGIVGSEDQQPGLANVRPLARVLGMPAFPLTPTFPWLGPLGLLPLPVKYRILFGDPLHFTGDSDDEDAAIERHVDVVRDAIHALLERGLAQREGIFRG